MSKILTYGIVITLVMALAPPSGHSQEQLTLDDCIELALKNRAAIIRARGAESVAAAGKLSALGAFLPQISAAYSYSKGEETSIDPEQTAVLQTETVLDTTTINGQTAIDAIEVPTQVVTSDEQDIGPNKRLTLSADMMLFSVPNLFNYLSARSDHERARLDVMASEQDLILSVKTVYYAYLASEQNVEVQRDAVKRAEEQLKLIQSRFDLGSASLSDVLRQKVQFGNDRLGLLRAENAVDNARADLAYTIGLDPRSEHRFATAYDVRAYDGTLEEAIAFGLDNNPSLLSSEASFSAAEKGVTAAWGRYLPTLGLFADYTNFSGTQAFPRAFDYSSNTLTYGFSIQYNIFDGFFRERQLTQAKVTRNNAGATLSDTRNLTVSNIKTAYLDIEQLKEQKDVSQENVAAAEEDMKITQEKYNLGAATILDLLTSQVSLKEAQVALIQADFDLNLAVAQLEAAMGKR
ncbi:hypothetical protein GF420_09100 [candidate division GN15 bacterium]|nr:hypothetical protein [candidate division GN15 bacterium]